MKALFFLFLSGVAFADLPRLTIEHGEARQSCRLDEVDINVRVEGDFVETRMSINFFNETSLNQEGEFRLPLPDGASVNYYALEIDGKMREAVVVEKEQARRAYETIKSRNIDPGIVEKMEDNVYRTRIFPVLPNEGKRVSIGYIQPMEKNGEVMVYRLPFNVAEKIGKFKIKIEGDLDGIIPELTGGESFKQNESDYSYACKNSSIEGDLVLERKASDGDFAGVIREIDGESFAYISGAIPKELANDKLQKPKTITVVWDASANGYVRDIKSEVDFLGKLLEELGNVSVQLITVHDGMEDRGEYRVEGGDWKKIRTVIEGVFYDGAADWRKVSFDKMDSDAIFLFGGGESAFSIKQPKILECFEVIRSGGIKTDRVFTEMARKSGGVVINLSLYKTADAVREALKPRLLVTTLIGGVKNFYSEVVDGQVRIFAKMERMNQNDVVVDLKCGAVSRDSISVKFNLLDGGNALRYLWAQRALDDMVRQGSLIAGKEKADIIAHCQNYGLVSDFTSLIVLERIQDYIEFHIAPSDPLLLSVYNKTLEEMKVSRQTIRQNSRLLDAWRSRSNWHATKYPWVEVALLPRYMRVKKWTDAQASVFEKEQLSQTNIAEFLAWKKEAEQVMRAGDKVSSKKMYLDWNLQIAHLIESGKELGAKDTKLPAKGEFGVSVRGLVNEPQTMTFKNGATLRDAVKKAGGIHFSGTESRVAVYRSGKRSVYNLLSEAYKDVILLPGDMVVAMSEDYYGCFDDPFAAAPPDPIDSSASYKKAPAVVDGDLPLNLPSSTGSWGGESSLGASSGGEPRSNWERAQSEELPLLLGKVQEVKAQVENEELIAEILKEKDLWAAYQKKRPEMGNSLDFFTKVAEEFYKRNETKKARQVLSNFFGNNGFHVPSLRAAAYWMMQFKDYDGSVEIFEMIAQKFPEDPLLALDVMKLKRIAGDAIPKDSFSEWLGSGASKSLMDPKNSIFAEMLIMEQNRFKVANFDSLTRGFSREKEVFASDIRILVSCSDSENRTYLKVTDPTDAYVDGSGTSLTGGRMVSGNGVAEFMVRRAMPGEYKLNLANAASQTYQVEIFLNWGKTDESRTMFTLSGNGDGQTIDAGVVKFDLGQP